MSEWILWLVGMLLFASVGGGINSIGISIHKFNRVDAAPLRANLAIRSDRRSARIVGSWALMTTFCWLPAPPFWWLRSIVVGRIPTDFFALRATWADFVRWIILAVVLAIAAQMLLRRARKTISNDNLR
jgi:hypothetical protein